MEENQPFSFGQWIAYAFNHPVPERGKPGWYHDADYDGEWWNPLDYPETTIAYLTSLFENAPKVLTPFTDAQINQGLRICSAKRTGAISHENGKYQLKSGCAASIISARFA